MPNRQLTDGQVDRSEARQPLLNRLTFRASGECLENWGGCQITVQEEVNKGQDCRAKVSILSLQEHTYLQGTLKLTLPLRKT